MLFLKLSSLIDLVLDAPKVNLTYTTLEHLMLVCATLHLPFFPSLENHHLVQNSTSYIFKYQNTNYKYQI